MFRHEIYDIPYCFGQHRQSLAPHLSLSLAKKAFLSLFVVASENWLFDCSTPPPDQNETLHIPKVNRYDRGIYRCHAANNVYGSTEYDVMLEVNYKPLIRLARFQGAYGQVGLPLHADHLVRFGVLSPSRKLWLNQRWDLIVSLLVIRTAALKRNGFPREPEQIWS